MTMIHEPLGRSMWTSLSRASGIWPERTSALGHCSACLSAVGQDALFLDETMVVKQTDLKASGRIGAAPGGRR
jgi:hypothetical protein